MKSDAASAGNLPNDGKESLELRRLRHAYSVYQRRYDIICILQRVADRDEHFLKSTLRSQKQSPSHCLSILRHSNQFVVTHMCYKILLICFQCVFGMFSYPVFLEESDRFTVMDNRQVICLGVYSQADELTIRHKLLQSNCRFLVFLYIKLENFVSRNNRSSTARLEIQCKDTYKKIEMQAFYPRSVRYSPI